MKIIVSLFACLVSLSASASELVGTWQVIMTVQHSTCSGVRRGDEKAEQWIISRDAGVHKVKVVGNDGTPKEYVQGNDGTGQLEFVDAATRAQSLIVIDAVSMSGERYVADAIVRPAGERLGPKALPAVTSCLITYRIRLIR